ncbi:unnamed protein product [Candidula unifasciata]|uniref:Uncharacterized protein n=1 Tax=Candidula unifasciata TaxID=100452 RepID=A0A8S4A3P8_9EUPU|nr:unnamed protein product [Candidula unifasciata]
MSANDMVDALGVGDTDEPDARGQPRNSLPRMSESAFSSLLYKMDHPNKGVALIINNTTFHPRLFIRGHIGDSKRSLQEPSADAELMVDLLKTLGFKDVMFYKDQTAADMKSILQKVASMDHTDSDCFVCVILTHGDDGYVCATDDKIPVDELLQPFKGHLCKSLAAKPKLFLIQSSKGFMPEKGERSFESAGEESNEEETVRRIPTEADFLMAYSMIPAWKNISKPSWFIQSIHDVFEQNWQTMDLLTMITRVNKKVAQAFELNANNVYENQNRQIPYITSMLTKDLFFTTK